MKTSTKIPFETLPNTRDLGGMKTKDGRRIKPQLLLRSGALCSASPHDLHILQDTYHLKQIIDFRTSHEQRVKPDPALDGAVHVENSILEEKTLGITKEGGQDNISLILYIFRTQPVTPEQYMKRMYENLSTCDHGCKQYGVFLHRLLDDKNGASLWHCSLGKDRAGVGTALLQYALGVSMEDIVADYMLTGECLASHTEQDVAKARPLANTEEELGYIRAVAGVKEEYIASVFPCIKEKFGSMERYYADALGLTAAEQERLRELYLTD